MTVQVLDQAGSLITSGVTHFMTSAVCNDHNALVSGVNGGIELSHRPFGNQSYMCPAHHGQVTSR